MQDDADVRARAAEILARDEYARFRPSAIDSGLRELLEHVSDWLDALPLLMETAPVLYWSLLIGLLLVGLLLVVHIIWTIQQALRVEPPAPSHAALATTRDFVGEARALASSGAFLEASHRLLLASLAHSARRHLIELQPQDSNRAVCRKLDGAPLPAPLRGQLVALIRQTDAAWFGHRAEDPALYDAWQAAYGELCGHGR